MNALLKHIDPKMLSFIMIVFSVLSFASILFFVWGKLKPDAKLAELKMRCRSWWIMATVFLIATVFSTMVSYIAFALLSFVTLRELFSILHLRHSDRSAMLLCYLAIPIQYFFTYQGYIIASLVFIPVFMFVVLPFRLVVVGQTEGIIQSMAIIPGTLMIALFGLSHMGLLLSLPGGRGLLFFLVFITEMNDVFQFVWGKLLGKHKILPRVSPNKTWEGFIGGVLTTTALGIGLRFLTPCTIPQIAFVSFLTANAGFIGDVIISSVKRDLQLKDTSTAIPGHGGVLDRVDSLVVAAPVFFTSFITSLNKKIMRQLFLNIIYKGIVPFILKPLTGVKYKHREVLTEAKQFIIIANHNSHIDTLALMSAMPRHKIKEVKPVAAGDYFGKNKLRSFLTKALTNALLIPRSCALRDKERNPFAIMMEAIKAGQSLIIYPEGSRGKANEMQEFKNGIGHILLKYPHVAYIPTYIENTGHVLPKDRIIPMPFNCKVIFGDLHYCKGTNAKEVVTNMFNEVCELKAA